MAGNPVTHIEPILDTCLDALRAGLPAALLLTKVNVDAAGRMTDIDLSPPDPELGYSFGGMDALVYPLVEVAAPDGTLHDFSLYQATADHDSTVLVRCQATDSTPERIYRKCLRYGASILYVLMQPNAFGQGFVLSQTDGLRYAYRGWNIEQTDGVGPERAGGVLLGFKLEGGASAL